MAKNGKLTSPNSSSDTPLKSLQTKKQVYLPSDEDPSVGVTINVPIKTPKFALISVFDKTGIVEFAKAIGRAGYKILSTGGTLKTLEDAGVNAVPVKDLTGNPEIFEGRMKTISFEIEGGILFDRSKKDHINEAFEHGILPIDIVVSNLYPFEQTIAKENVTLEDAVENIDVGGPTMLRSAAKNFKSILVVSDPADYEEVAKALDNPSSELKMRLAQKTFEHLSYYDSQIAKYFREQNGELFPNQFTLPGNKIANLRYGENPHQQAALYTFPNSNSPLGKLEKHWGRDLSLVNITDIDAGLSVVRMFETPAAVVIKHNTPCGIALGATPVESLKRAIESDPVSAFGGVIVMNQKVDLETAKIIAAFKSEQAGNIDIVASPFISDESLKLLESVRKSMGVYTFGQIPKNYASSLNIKSVEGGFILQNADQKLEDGFNSWEVVTKLKPTDKQMEQMKIAWMFATRIKSNCVLVIDKDLPMTRGIGSGQTSRVGSTIIALDQAKDFVNGAILASDSFFPFPDSVNLAAKAGIGAIIEQGDSVNDKSSIDAADKAGIPIVLTHRRAFWH